jgi:GTP-binding protein
MFNPELLDKPRILAITKSDMVDDELKELLKPELPKGVPYLFISSVAQQGIQELKDLLWKTINENREQEPKRKPQAMDDDWFEEEE